MALAAEIQQMTLAEKLRVMEALWDDLCRNEEQIEVPAWHKNLLDEREQMIQSGQAHFVDWETAKKQIEAKIRED